MKIKKGDIVLISYRIDPICWWIQYCTKSKFSHVAWVINSKEMISAHSTCIKKEKIKKLNNRFLFPNVRIIRLKNLNKEKINKVTQIIKKQIGHYNYFKFMGNIFSLFFIGKRISKLPNCALLIASALAKVGYYINKKRIKFVVPEDFNKWKQKIIVKDY